MADKSKIEWTDATWNPIRARAWEIQNDGSGKERIGWHCEHVSDGCRNCYAEKINLRLGTGFEFKPGNLRGKPGFYGGGIDRPEVFLDEKMLLAPLRWKRPRMIFVGSMTDLFADFVTDEMLDQVFAVMALAPQHTFQVLTKRAARMRSYLDDRQLLSRIADYVLSSLAQGMGRGDGPAKMPFRNVWLGVSAERQQEADERIPLLMTTPASVRFVSAEPLLGSIRLDMLDREPDEYDRKMPGFATVEKFYTDALRPASGIQWKGGYAEREDGGHDVGIDWVIAGGESGAQARPSHPSWFRSLRDQCAAAGVPFLFKQWGEYAFVPLESATDYTRGGKFHGFKFERIQGGALVRFGKKGAGRKLDGVEHNGFPS